MLKFNIDGASRGNPNLSGIGGVLRKGRARFWGVSMWSRVEGFNEGSEEGVGRPAEEGGGGEWRVHATFAM